MPRILFCRKLIGLSAAGLLPRRADAGSGEQQQDAKEGAALRAWLLTVDLMEDEDDEVRSASRPGLTPSRKSTSPCYLCHSNAFSALHNERHSGSIPPHTCCCALQVRDAVAEAAAAGGMGAAAAEGVEVVQRAAFDHLSAAFGRAPPLQAWLLAHVCGVDTAAGAGSFTSSQHAQEVV